MGHIGANIKYFQGQVPDHIYFRQKNGNLYSPYVCICCISISFVHAFFVFHEAAALASCFSKTKKAILAFERPSFLHTQRVTRNQKLHKHLVYCSLLNYSVLCNLFTLIFLLGDQSCNIDEEAVEAAISQCNMLETLDVRFCPKVRDLIAKIGVIM